MDGVWTLRYAWQRNRLWFWRHGLLLVLRGLLKALLKHLMEPVRWISQRIKGTWWRTRYHAGNLWYFLRMARRGYFVTYQGTVFLERDQSWWMRLRQMVWMYRWHELTDLLQRSYWRKGYDLNRCP